MAGKIILIIEDNPLNLKLVEYLFTVKGYDVHSAMSAKDALDKLVTLLPDIILLDIQLPGMDGLELTRKLRGETKFQKIPIIAITAYAMKGDEEKAYAAGCNGYITKPIDTRTLPKIIAGYLHSKS